MQTTREMPPNPSTPGPADIPLEELPRCGHGTASPSAGRASLSASSFADDARSGHHETGSAVPSTEVARPGKNPVFYYFTRLALFWTTYIRCTVNFSACRDHLGTWRGFRSACQPDFALSPPGLAYAKLLMPRRSVVTEFIAHLSGSGTSSLVRGHPATPRFLL